jgi:hypothetical protein
MKMRLCSLLGLSLFVYHFLDQRLAHRWNYLYISHFTNAKCLDGYLKVIAVEREDKMFPTELPIIHTDEDFDSASFYAPNWDWTPPYPYCPDDVLFPVKYRATDNDEIYGHRQVLHEETLSDASFKEQILANDSLGG